MLIKVNMGKFYTLLLFIISYINCLAQNEAGNWYFRQSAGLSFNSGAPVTLTNGLLNTLKGCASISDANGNLLFYTNGTVVRNRNHNVMTNGNNLKGNSISSQSAIIIPKPGSTTNYFIFTIDFQG